MIALINYYHQIKKKVLSYCAQIFTVLLNVNSLEQTFLLAIFLEYKSIQFRSHRISFRFGF